MAPTDSWPRIVCERFDGESDAGYFRRSRRIIEIVTDFRFGRYDAESGDRMERELTALQDPVLAYDLGAADEMLAQVVQRHAGEVRDAR